jgi:hypothetical protein
VVEGARLESVFRGNSNVGSNPTLSAILFNNLVSLIQLLGLIKIVNSPCPQFPPRRIASSGGEGAGVGNRPTASPLPRA